MAIPRVMLRIVSKAGSIKEFIQLYCRLCDRESIYVVTREPAEVGLATRFRITLADDRQVMEGSGEVVEVFSSKENQYGHPGMKLRFGDLDQASKGVLERLIAANPALGHKSPLALIGELNEGSIEAIVQCQVSREPDPEPGITPGASSASASPGPAQVAGMDPSGAVNAPTEKVATLPHMPAPFAGLPAAEPGIQNAPPHEVRDTTPIPVQSAPPQSALVHDTTPFPAPLVPAPPEAFMNGGAPAMNAAVPAMNTPLPVMNAGVPAVNGTAPVMNGGAPAMNAAAFAVGPRRGPGYVEPTQLVRPLKRPINRNAVIISAIAVVLGGVIGSYLIWGRSSSSSAASASAEPGAGNGEQTEPDGPATATDCKIMIASKPDGAMVRVDDQELGTTPLQTTMPCGKAVFEIARDRWQPLTHEAEILAETDNRIEVELVRPRVELEVLSKPEGASVIVDGKNVGKTPLTTDVAGYVRTTVVVRKSGYRSYRKRFHAKPPKHTVKTKLRKRRR